MRSRIKLNLKDKTAHKEYAELMNYQQAIHKKRLKNSEPITIHKSDFEEWHDIDDQRLFTPLLEDYDQDEFTIAFNNELKKLSGEHNFNEWLTGQIAVAADCLFSLASSELYFQQSKSRVKAYQKDLIKIKNYINDFNGITPDYKYLPELLIKIQHKNEKKSIGLESELIHKK
jgi:hypothetical protein